MGRDHAVSPVLSLIAVGLWSLVGVRRLKRYHYTNVHSLISEASPRLLDRFPDRHPKFRASQVMLVSFETGMSGYVIKEY